MAQIQEDGKIVVCNLACKLVDDRHTAENIQRWFQEVLDEYKIKDIQLLVVSVDSAANIQKATREFIKDLKVDIAPIEELGGNEQESKM